MHHKLSAVFAKFHGFGRNFDVAVRCEFCWKPHRVHHWVCLPLMFHTLPLHYLLIVYIFFIRLRQQEDIHRPLAKRMTSSPSPFASIFRAPLSSLDVSRKGVSRKGQITNSIKPIDFSHLATSFSKISEPQNKRTKPWKKSIQKDSTTCYWNGQPRQGFRRHACDVEVHLPVIAGGSGPIF